MDRNSKKIVSLSSLPSDTRKILDSLETLRAQAEEFGDQKFITQVGNTITFFNPLTLEVQVSQYDIDTLGIALYGNQTKSMEDGIYTIYDTQNNIYSQFNLYEIKDDFNNLLYEVKENRNQNIDFSKSYTNITGQ